MVEINYLWALFQSLWEVTETNSNMPQPDPNEYPNLAAYARYRIMLLYLLQGWDSDAQVIYETLQEIILRGHPVRSMPNWRAYSGRNTRALGIWAESCAGGGYRCEI